MLFTVRSSDIDVKATAGEKKRKCEEGNSVRMQSNVQDLGYQM